MSKCKQCGIEVLFPFGCCYCRKAFCPEHVIPKKHQCPKLSQELKYCHQKKKTMKEETLKRKKFVSPILAFCIILILSSTITARTSYYSGSGELRNPTYQEALQFIESDQTDKNQYKEGKYTCADFAADFKSNALKASYRCGYVLVFLADWSHAINCFNTTDCGLIFVEPQEDEIVTLKIGQPYWDRTKYAPQFYGRTYNDTVTGFLITW